MAKSTESHVFVAKVRCFDGAIGISAEPPEQFEQGDSRCLEGQITLRIYGSKKLLMGLREATALRDALNAALRAAGPLDGE